MENLTYTNSNKLSNSSALFKSQILLGSHARGEVTPTICKDIGLEMIDIVIYNNEYYLVDEGKIISISNLRHPELILDAYTQDPLLQPYLLKCKEILISDQIIQITRRHLIDSYKDNKKIVKNEGLQEYKGQWFKHYNLDLDTYYYSKDLKSVKYGPLRTIQIYILILLLNTPHYFSELGKRPTLRSKLEFLLNNDVISFNHGMKIYEVYENLLGIYSLCRQEYYYNGYDRNKLGRDNIASCFLPGLSEEMNDSITFINEIKLPPFLCI